MRIALFEFFKQMLLSINQHQTAAAIETLVLHAGDHVAMKSGLVKNISFTMDVLLPVRSNVSPGG